MAGACDTSAMRIGIISAHHGLSRPEACGRLAARAGSSCRSRWRHWSWRATRCGRASMNSVPSSVSSFSGRLVDGSCRHRFARGGGRPRRCNAVQRRPGRDKLKLRERDRRGIAMFHELALERQAASAFLHQRLLVALENGELLLELLAARTLLRQGVLVTLAIGQLLLEDFAVRTLLRQRLLL